MLTLRVLHEAQVRGMYSWIESSFPADECRPLQMMLRLMRKGLYEVLDFSDGNGPVGYALSLLPKDSRAVLLDYLVVADHMRGQGIGSAMLAMLREYYAPHADAILIESEHPAQAPDALLARRRFGFYTRAGAVLLPFRVLLFGVDYAIFALPTAATLPGADWSSILLGIYRQTLPARFYATQVRLLRSDE